MFDDASGVGRVSCEAFRRLPHFLTPMVVCWIIELQNVLVKAHETLRFPKIRIPPNHPF